MATDLVVRKARVEDTAAVHDLLFEFNGEALPPDTLSRRIQQVTDLETAFLAEQGGCPGGLMVLRIVPALADAQDWAEITELYVRPAFRRQGIGTALVHAALEHSRLRGCSELHLLVDPANREANAFYRASGFHHDSCALCCRV
jgi:ribosomal protein S18 acetylase RimI-like enzyme